MHTINFHDTHVYPGCLATMSTVPAGVAPAVAEFSDGATAGAEIERLSPDELLIRIEPYTTARHTRISAKSWRLSYDGDRELWKVVAKL